MESLRKQSVLDFCLLIVDNGSSDGSIPWIRENMPEAVYLQPGDKLPQTHTTTSQYGFPIYVMALDTNTGFSGAVNVASRLR